MNRCVFSAVLAAGVFTAGALAQSSIDQTPRITSSDHWPDWLRAPYSAKKVAPVSFENSSRLESLLRAGQLYLSLQDAIALALENNLDIELLRFTPDIARTDVERTKGGGQLRGISLTVNEVPAGIGGPSSPLLNSAATGVTPSTAVVANISDQAAITQTQNSALITGQTPFSLGPPIPQYDPAITGQLSWVQQTTPEANSLLAGTSSLVSRDITGNVGYQQGFSPGTQLSVGFENMQTNSNSLQNNYNPFTTSSLGLNVIQPLLRGFGIALNRRFIRIAKNNQKITDQVFRQQLISTVSGVMRLYYDLVSLQEDVKVKQQTLELAQRLYEDNKSKVDLGTLAPIELVRAQAQVAASQQDLANSQGFELQQELIVKTVLTRRGTADPAIRAARIIPTNVIAVPERDDTRPVQDLLADAFGNRPELQEAGLQITNSRISLEGSRNELLPELDLVGGVQNAGLGGQLNPAGPAAVPAPFIGGYGTALSEILRHDYPTYSVGVQLNLPLRNRVAQADVVRDEMQVRQSEIRSQQLENQVRLEVEDALIALQRSRAAYDAAVQTRALQEQSLAIEQERYTAGVSTNFLVIQYQSFLAQARSTEVAAKSTWVKARTALERATGLTLRNNNVSVEEAYRGRISVPPSPLPAP